MASQQVACFSNVAGSLSGSLVWLLARVHSSHTLLSSVTRKSRNEAEHSASFIVSSEIAESQLIVSDNSAIFEPEWFFIRFDDSPWKKERRNCARVLPPLLFFVLFLIFFLYKHLIISHR